MLKKMPPWRHSLFALVLATRSYSNFALWCEVKQVQGRTEFLNALKQCWSYHYDKFNHIDLEAAFDQVEPYLPLELEDYTEGDSFAFDVAVMLDVALSSVPMSSKNAQDASQASMASVIRLCENNYPDQELDEDSLIELEDIQNELKYQIDLMYKVMEPRSEENIKALLQFALEPGLSNIGLENELTCEDFSACFVIDTTPKGPSSKDNHQSKSSRHDAYAKGKTQGYAKGQRQSQSQGHENAQVAEEAKGEAIDEALLNLDPFDLEADIELVEASDSNSASESGEPSRPCVYGKVDKSAHKGRKNSSKEPKAKAYGAKGKKDFKKPYSKQRHARVFTSKGSENQYLSHCY